VDFDLKEFEVVWDSLNNRWLIKEVKVKPLTPGGHREFEIYAIVDSVDTDSFTASWRNSIYTVRLTSETRCEVGDFNYMGPVQCLSQLQKGLCVEVETADDPSTTATLTAQEIEVKDSADKCGHPGGHGHHSTHMEIKEHRVHTANMRTSTTGDTTALTTSSPAGSWR